MGTHPIFESDFDCLTDSKDQINIMSEQMTLKGTLKGHNGWVTQIATTPVFPDMLLSASRDKTIIMWHLTREDTQYGIPNRRLQGHSHFVSAARDRTIKLWNTLGICKYTIQEQGHTEWVSCVRFSPLPQNPVIVSSGWDKLVKVWNLSNCKLKRDYHGHTGYLNCVTVSPDGSLCASGGKDGTAKLWDLGSEEAKPLHTLDSGDEINALSFSPNRYWLCAAAGAVIKIWDLEQKIIVEELKPEVMGHKEGSPPVCTSLCWSSDGQTLFAGYTDNLIRVWSLSVPRSLA